MSKESIRIDVTTIPSHVRDNLAAATLAFVRDIIEQPGGRERLDAKKAARSRSNERSEKS